MICRVRASSIDDSVHVLKANSPAVACSLGFGQLIVDKIDIF